MAGKLKIVIVTPGGEKLAGEADEIVAPGHVGQFGVLPGHIEFFTRNPPGVFTVLNDGKLSRWAVGAGFIEVGHDQVQLLVQSAEKSGEIDAERAKRAKTRAEEALSKLEGRLDDPAYEMQLLSLRRAEARLEAVAGR